MRILAPIALPEHYFKSINHFEKAESPLASPPLARHISQSVLYLSPPFLAQFPTSGDGLKSEGCQVHLTQDLTKPSYRQTSILISLALFFGFGSKISLKAMFEHTEKFPHQWNVPTFLHGLKMELSMDGKNVFALRRQQSAWVQRTLCWAGLVALEGWELSAMPWGFSPCRARRGQEARTAQHRHLLFPEWIFHMGAPSRSLLILLSQWLWALQKLTL